MEQIRALEVIQSLAAGTDPVTGEILGAGSSLQNPEVVRALFVAAAALQSATRPATPKAAKAKDPTQPPAAGKAWSPDEDAQLAAEFDAGTPEPELAAKHQRTAGAIRYRLVKLGRLDPSAYQGRIRQ
jgi:hypothetical protein